MISTKAKALSNHQIVTLAVYLLGGDAQRIETEDIAVKANELAPGRFAWRKYPDQINIENVRTFLSDAKKPKNGAYLIEAGKDGWILTEAGLTSPTCARSVSCGKIAKNFSANLVFLHA
jgi:hypothetical protein